MIKMLNYGRKLIFQNTEVKVPQIYDEVTKIYDEITISLLTFFLVR
jgi:hypothetical protein